MDLYKLFSFFHYNIGFISSVDLPYIDTQSINWMKHKYKDRFFADPFILKYTDSEIFILVEEFIYDCWKGHISLLVVDKNNYELKRTKVLLDLDTHLSFPFIYSDKDKIYVIPENSASGTLKVYLYDDEKEELIFVSVIMNEGVIDPIIIPYKDSYYLLGGIQDKSPNETLYMWKSNDVFSGYQLCVNNPIKNDKSSSRRAGSIFSVNDTLYAPTQSCLKRYGEAINVCKINDLNNICYNEEQVHTLYPSFEYPRGIHTLNTYKELSVVDGLTYLFSPFKKVLNVLKRRI